MSKRFISEIIGTFSLVFCGTGAMVINDFTGGTVTHVGVAITFGLIVMGMIYAFGDISGAHMNPAVTIGFAYAKKFPWKEVPAYVLAQLIGAFLASGILLYLFPESQTLGATLPGLSALKVFILEIVVQTSMELGLRISNNCHVKFIDFIVAILIHIFRITRL